MYNVKSNFRLKDIDSEGLTAYVSIFDNIDSDGDMIVHGAFTKSINERGPGSTKPRIKHLWQHSPWEIIGVPETMGEDSEGLLVRSRFGTDQNSQDKKQQHIDGLVTEFSIGFQTIKSEKVMADDKVDHYKLTEIKLWEYSSVTWGANELTHTVDAKGLAPKLEELNDRMDRLTKALRDGRYTDETCEQFEIELKQIQTIYNDLIEANQPGQPTIDESGDTTLSDEDISDILKTYTL